MNIGQQAAGRIAWIGLIFLLITGCTHFQNGDEDPVLARVGGQALTLSEAVSGIPANRLEQDSLGAIRSYRDRWVEEAVMEQEARRLGLDREEEVARKVARLERQLLIDALREVILEQNADEIDVESGEAQSYYQENRERFRLDERYVQVRHLRASTRSDAVNARNEIMQGREWESVAGQYSIDSERQIRLSEQFIPASLVFPDNPAMNRMLEQIGLTEISPVQQVGGEYHFVQLMDERPEGDHPDLDWLVEKIEEWLHLEKSRRFINSYRRNLYLRAEANNEIELTDVGELGLSSR